MSNETTTHETTAIPAISVTQEYMERRKSDPNLKRRLADEAICSQALTQAKNHFGCKIEPNFWQSVGDGGKLQANFQMKITGPNENIERECAEYIKDLLKSCHCTFAAISEIHPDAPDKPNLKIYICTTW